MAKLGEMAPDFTLTSSEGNTHSLSDFKGKYVVLEWTNYGCPFVKKHYKSNNMQNLQKEMTGKDVVWLSICSSAEGKQGYFEGSELQKEVKGQNANCTAYLVDKEGKVGKMYQAKTTPHMYVVSPEGKLIYTGAIDDKKSVDPEDVKTAKNYIKTVLMDAMSGKELSVGATQPYGCSVKYK
ncbi:thioredoxin family protein [Candidatus Kapabacteria bacterium]|nr:thioredoxin family protein [Candidatus Kapabacteria bacterium]